MFSTVTSHINEKDYKSPTENILRSYTCTSNPNYLCNLSILRNKTAKAKKVTLLQVYSSFVKDGKEVTVLQMRSSLVKHKILAHSPVILCQKLQS